uniref:Uncharacterized protein n=1 Tax=Arundo donax TaxID=35708 RepID=A0A0A9CDW9_ARUDO
MFIKKFMSRKDIFQLCGIKVKTMNNNTTTQNKFSEC